MLLTAVASLAAGPAAGETSLEVFSRPGCPHCAEAHRFLVELAGERSDFSIIEHDVTRDAVALQRLRDLSARAGIKTPGVPAFAIGPSLLVGFDPQTTPARLRALLDAAGPPTRESDACSVDPSRCETRTPGPASSSIELPLVGTLDVNRLGLPLFTIVVGLIDGFNPCATWVLLFLLAMLVNLKRAARGWPSSPAHSWSSAASSTSPSWPRGSRSSWCHLGGHRGRDAREAQASGARGALAQAGFRLADPRARRPAPGSPGLARVLNRIRPADRDHRGSGASPALPDRTSLSPPARSTPR